MSTQKPFFNGSPQASKPTEEPESPFLNEELFSDMGVGSAEEWASRLAGYRLESPFQLAFEAEHETFHQPDEFEEDWYDEEYDEEEEFDEYEFNEEFDEEFEGEENIGELEEEPFIQEGVWLEPEKEKERDWGIVDAEQSPAIPAGKEELTNVSLLRRHRGTGPDLILSWNDMARKPQSVDVVVHLHGYSLRAGKLLHLSRDILSRSGLDWSDPEGLDRSPGRSRPTLALLPRGHFFGGKSGRGYSFPALITEPGLRQLIDFGLNHLAQRLDLPGLAQGRLIVTAHSGGGAALLKLLRYNDPHEIHVFDGLYQDPAALIRWGKARIARDQQALAAGTESVERYMFERGGALRVLYRGGTKRHSLAVHRALTAVLPSGSELRKWYRVEETSVSHLLIPRRYGWRLLANASADISAAVVPSAPAQDIGQPKPGTTGQSISALFGGLGSLLMNFLELIASGQERLAVTLAYQQGITDENKLTNLVFFARHPELGGRRIRSDEKELAREWLQIRNQLVRPALPNRYTRELFFDEPNQEAIPEALWEATELAEGFVEELEDEDIEDFRDKWDELEFDEEFEDEAAIDERDLENKWNDETLDEDRYYDEEFDEEELDEEFELPDFPSRRWQDVKERVAALANEQYEHWDRGHRHETNPKYFDDLVKYWVEGAGKSLKKAIEIVKKIQDPNRKRRPAWSAAFISWIMEKAGAGNVFKKSGGHYVYIADAKRNRGRLDKPIWAWKISEVKPEVGDLLCNARCSKESPNRCGANYENVDNGTEWSTHCDIVTWVGDKEITVIGGNARDYRSKLSSTVGMKKVKLDEDGKVKLKGDPKNDYFAIVRIMTDPDGRTDIAPPPAPPSTSRPDPAIDVEDAVRYNRRSSRKLGWSFDQIRRFFGFGQMPDERRLALTVAQWQQSHGLKVDGKIGPNTWKRMQALMGVGRTPAPVATSGSGDIRQKTGKKSTGIISVPLEHMVPGIDVAHHEGRIDWARVAGGGVRFAYIKATEGRTWQDNFFQKNWQEAKANGVVRGAYHLLRRGSSSSVESQAQNFLKTVTLTSGDMPPALDVETKVLKKIIAEEDVEQAWKFIYQWVELIRQKTGYTCVLYMSPRRAASLKLNFGNLPILDLWTPSYGANRPLRFATDKPNIKNLPTLPLDVNNRLIWSKWMFWQYSSKGRVAGIASHVDLNLFNGNDSDFNRWLQQVQP